MLTNRDHLDPHALRADVARRVLPVCDTLPAPERDALVERIVAIELRWRERPRRGDPLMDDRVD